MASFKGIWHSIKDELGYDIGKAFLGNIVGDLMGKLVDKGKEQVGVAVDETFKKGAEYRDEFVGEVMRLDARERDELMRYIRLREEQLPRTYGAGTRYAWNEENKFFARMGGLRKSIIEEAGDDSLAAREGRKEIWQETLKAFAHLSDEEKDLVVEALTHDVALQFLSMLWEQIQTHAPAVVHEIDARAERTARSLQGHVARLRRPNSTAANPGRIFVIGFFIDPIGWFRQGYHGYL